MSSDPVASALDAGNEAFHNAYRGARDGVRNQVPILVVLPNELVLHHRDRRRAVPYSRPSFARAKSAAHIAVALFALSCGEPGTAQVRDAFAAIYEHISRALEQRSQSTSGPDGEVDRLLERCLGYAQMARERAIEERSSHEFASDAGPRILRITEVATCEQVTSLHEAVEALFRELSVRDQAELQVVVVGDHQARTRSLGMQYFKRRFREGEADQRVTYGENVNDEQEAISLVATRRLDQRIARAFFGDEHRLQRDVLGDAAKRCLDQMSFPR